MRLREAGGNLTRASSAQIFVVFAEGEQGGAWVEVPKTIVREILDLAHARNVEEVDVEMVGNVFRLGIELVADDDIQTVEPVCSGCGEPWNSDHECE